MELSLAFAKKRSTQVLVKASCHMNKVKKFFLNNMYIAWFGFGFFVGGTLPIHMAHVIECENKNGPLAHEELRELLEIRDFLHNLLFHIEMTLDEQGVIYDKGSVG